MKCLLNKLFILLASMVIVISLNAAAVIAAEHTYELWPSDFGEVPANGTDETDIKLTGTGLGTSGYFDYNFSDGLYKLQSFGTRVTSQGGKLTNDTGITFIGEMMASGNGDAETKRTIKINPDRNASVTVYVYSTSNNRNYTVVGTDSNGENVKFTENYSSKNTVYALNFEITAGTYSMYPGGTNDVLLGIVVNEEVNSEVEVWPVPEKPTGNRSENLVNYTGTKTQLFNGTALSEGVTVSNENMIDTSNVCIRFGDVVNTNEWGYLYFTQDGDFTLAVSGFPLDENSKCTVCLGTVDNSGIIKALGEISLNDYNSGVESYKITGSTANKYVIYAKTKDSFALTGASVLIGDNAGVQVEACKIPSVTLSNAALDKGYVTFNTTFNDFTTDVYIVNNIILRGAKLGSGNWTEFAITNIKNNGDGTYSFKVKCLDPSDKAKFQVLVAYVSDNPNLKNGTSYSDVLDYIPKN